MNHKMFAAAGVAFGLAALLVACGGSGYNSPTSPTPAASNPAGGGSGVTAAATITITASGISPSQVRIALGQQVLFVNNDSTSHEITSNPHPTHTDCPTATIGLLAPGQSRVSGNFNDDKACGFHDHLNPTDSRFQGQILVGEAQPNPGPGY